MTNAEAKKFLAAKLECKERYTRGCDEECEECDLCYEQGNMGEQKEALRVAIKSLEQEPKIGHWKAVSDGYGDNAYICECSECKDTIWVYKDADRKWNYCPNCGAKMTESEGKG